MLVLRKWNFPAKYLAKITGEEEKRAESFNGLGFALILSIVLVYMVMAAQFESLRHPFTILLTIPLAGVGSILAFLITGQTLNMMAFIGIIMLAGIAVNSSIILVDRINQLKAQGFALKEAVMQAAQQRIRPIIMTSLTTIFGFIAHVFWFWRRSFSPISYGFSCNRRLTDFYLVDVDCYPLCILYF